MAAAATTVAAKRVFESILCNCDRQHLSKGL